MEFIAFGGKRANFYGERPVVRKLDPIVALLAIVWSALADQKVVEFPPIECDFADIFPDGLPGLPSPQEVKFITDILPCTPYIVLPLYWMTLAK